MALTSPLIEYKEERVVGVKLDISPDILPRDTSIGTKIFTLVPNEARYVREVKTYIANFVLKTPAPFHFYVGDYRIRDEEEAQIFSIVNEPCRLVPVPIPRSALSSTPKLKSTENSMSNKRVTFFDADLSTSPVYRPLVNGIDMIDHSQTGGYNPSPHQEGITRSSKNVIENDLGANLDDSTSERKKRRRRRHHRNKKSKPSLAENSNDDEPLNESETSCNSNLCISNTSCSFVGAPKYDKSPLHSSNNKSHLDIVNEETESEDETSGESSKPKEFEFLTPSTNSIPRKRHGRDSSVQLGGKKKKLSDSAFESSSSASFSSPLSSDDSRWSSGKPRQDTPTVPRVIRNARTFETAKKIIDVFSLHQASESEQEGGTNNGGTALIKVENNTQAPSQSKVRDDSDYHLLTAIVSPGEIKVGDIIAFKVLELDERYNPTVSAYKEGEVYEILGTRIIIAYTKNDAVIRSGKYELVDENEDCNGEDVKPNVEPKANLEFSELIEPKVVPQVHMLKSDQESDTLV